MPIFLVSFLFLFYSLFHSMRVLLFFCCFVVRCRCRLFVRSFVGSFIRWFVCFCFAFNAVDVFISLFFDFVSHILPSLCVCMCVCLNSSELSASIMCRWFVSSVFNADEYRRFTKIKSIQTVRSIVKFESNLFVCLFVVIRIEKMLKLRLSEAVSVVRSL